MIDTRTPVRSRPAVQARGEDTRRRILESALDLFASQGYAGTATRQIAERAGVNLPAIQYYFGNKEGLYRAIIEDIIADTDRHMAALAPRIQRAIDDPDATREQLTELMGELLETFMGLVTSGTQVVSRRLFFARAEVEETPGLDRLHENGMRQIFNPCLGLLCRLHGKPSTDEEMTLRALAIIGQVVIFCSNPNRPIMPNAGLDPESVRLTKRVVREHVEAICRAVPPASAQ